jgi:hypothetical protein
MRPSSIIRPCSLVAMALLVIGGCTQRQAGSSEVFGIRPPDHPAGMTLYRFLDGQPTSTLPNRTGTEPGWGDRVRSNDDVVTIVAHSAYINSVPETLTTRLDGRTGYDLLLFAEVQENSAAGHDAPALVSIVYTAKDVQVPGVVNFTDAVAYGPTLYKGSPLKMKLTLMLLVRNTANQEGQVVDIIGGIVGQAAPQYAPIASTGVNVIRAILEAQPDVVVFDFETTFYSDDPEDLLPTILDSGLQNRIEEKVDQLVARTFSARDTATQSRLSSGFKPITLALAQNHLSAWGDLTPQVKRVVTDAGIAGNVSPHEIEECADGLCEIAKEESASLTDPPSPQSGTKSRAPVLGHRSWDRYFPWLSYAFYAIVETQPRGRQTPAIGLDANIRLNGQYLVSANNQPLRANYVTFAVIPGQVEQDDSVLRAASKLNQELLSSLTRSEETIAQAWKDIKLNSEKMIEAILKVQAERRARKLRREAESCDKFVEKFGRQYEGMVDALLTEMGKTDSMANANLPQQVFESVVSAFVAKRWPNDKECTDGIDGKIREISGRLYPKGKLKPQ